MRTSQEEQVRQLKIISYQLAPLSMVGKTGLWVLVWSVVLIFSVGAATVMGWMK